LTWKYSSTSTVKKCRIGSVTEAQYPSAREVTYGEL
jgi:hypothetical protein